ncbi:Atxe2 family lasso peptide isopeptidase [Sphingomonas sp. PL-96]|uniref:Atxe2 family lasso peptide isopeptidase n=1 Tax=Sphingomonas sp. PL-96 TaxID=2887201 RepID=UPI001E2A4BD0|nr:Atxe2 family lasso peptide isopeptidase [Sphingomonas sp. PL-96]MCC2977128.1 Atxe2 family lasso peptide isopeptidase [Sphingomonas sp. PL-96]
MATLLALSATASRGGPTLRETIELTDLSSVSISPDGRLAAYRQETASIEQNGYDLAWYVVPVDGTAPPRRLAGAGGGSWLNGTLLAEAPIWSPDSRWIVYRATIDGETQVWRAATNGSRAERLTSEAGDVAELRPLPRHRALLQVKAPRTDIRRAEEAARDQGVLVDARVDPSRPLLLGGRIDGRRASERLHGVWFGVGGLLDDRAPSTRMLDLATFALRAATAAEQQPATPEPMPPGLDPGTIISQAHPGDARGSVYLRYRSGVVEPVVARGTRLIECAAPSCRGRRIRHAAWLPRADQLLLTESLENGGTRLLRWDVPSGQVTEIAHGIAAWNGGRDRSRGCAVSSATAVCVSALANAPPRLIAVDLGDGRIRDLATPNALLASRVTSSFEPLEWHDATGRLFTGHLLRPTGVDGPVPLFITYYSCSGFLRGGLGDEFPLRQLAEQGIAALCINRYPAQDGPGAQADAYRIAQGGIEAIIDSLAARNIVDPARVGLGGVSFGGEVAAWIAIHAPGRLAALSIANVMPTPTYYWLNAVAGRDVPAALQREWGLGEPSPADPAWRRLSPAYNVDRIRTPFLMQLPEQEYRPNVELLARLQRAAVPAELWAFADEAHIKWQPRHRLVANRRNLDWFRFWLGHDADRDPAKEEQYRRWCAWPAAPAAACAHLASTQLLDQASASMSGKSQNRRSSAGSAGSER